MPNDPAALRKARRRLVTVFGATGFLGRRIVQHFLHDGFAVRAASRHPERTASIFEPNAVALMPVRVDVQNEAEVTAAVTGAYAVVNCVSLYIEHGRHTFDAVHVEAAARLSRLAREAGVEGLVHISGIAADPNSPSPYISARGKGEKVVQAAFPNAILIRPAVMFGPDDTFLTTLVKLVRMLPVYPMFGRGETKMQPVYVEDIAEAVTRLVANTGESQPCYELAAHKSSPMKNFFGRWLVTSELGRGSCRCHFSFGKPWASVAEHLPGAPLTRLQIALMQHDNVASPNWPGLPQLSITATAIVAVLPKIQCSSASA